MYVVDFSVGKKLLQPHVPNYLVSIRRHTNGTLICMHTHKIDKMKSVLPLESYLSRGLNSELSLSPKLCAAIVSRGLKRLQSRAHVCTQRGNCDFWR